MSSTKRVSSLVAGASILAVEAMKELGFCRWNHTLRLLQQHAKNNLRSYTTQAHKISGSTSAVVSNRKSDEKLKKSEESLRQVMYLSCWGPY